MLSYIEALEALSNTGTMGKAATRLRLSQSAISKRIASLEEKLGLTLIEKNGRRVNLTPEGRHLLERVQPLLAEFRSALQAEPSHHIGRLNLGISESVLSSWGARLLAATCNQLPSLNLEVHAHRSPVVVDRVLSGEYQLGIIAGAADQAQTLFVQEILREPMVLVPKNLERLPAKREGLNVITIESRSGTWSAIDKRFQSLGLVREREMESFFGVIQMALAGFGHGLVPWGVCEALRLESKTLGYFSTNELSRPVSLIARPSTIARQLPSSFLKTLVVMAPMTVTSRFP